MPELPIRRATKRDIRLITNSWLKSFRDGNFVRGIPNTIYYYQHHKILETLIPRCEVLIICNDQDEDQILGWVCAETVDTALVIHYLYIKHPFRKVGLARRLVEKLIETESPPAVMHTHETYASKKILKGKGWVYNPYLLFQTLPDNWSEE